MLDVRRLTVLEAVARHGSFTAAAAALHYSQPAVSQQISALERETGVQLVMRAGRRIWLSDAGIVMTAHARRVLSAIAEAEAALADIAQLRQGTVRLATFPSAGATLVPRAAAAFRSAHPGIVLELTAVPPSDAVHRVLGGSHDAAVILPGLAERELAATGDLVRERLLDDPFYAVLPTDHRLASEDVVHIADLAEETWIATSSPGHADADSLARTCATAGFTPDISFSIDDHLAVQGFVAAGAGVALVPQLGLSAIRPDIVVRPIDPPATRPVDIVTIRTSRQAPAVAAVLDSLRQASHLDPLP